MRHDAELHEFAGSGLSACVCIHGAELQYLRDPGGRDYLWDAGPVWPRHAPVLFPIVGRLKDDTLIHDGQSYRMTQHGFARDRVFTWVERSAEGCVLALSDDEQTRAMYPFPFRLEVRYAISGATLHITYTIRNPGPAVLPASIGAHPAFCWPLTPGTAKGAYSLEFEADETGPLPVLAGGLLSGQERPNPIQGQHLALDDALFAEDALILRHPASRSVRFAAAAGPVLTVAWDGFHQLGIWSKPGDFLCIEPWCGMASPADFEGDFADKPGLLHIDPGEWHAVTHSVTIER